MANIKNVLIVEDEKMTQRYLINILKQKKVHTVEAFDNASDAFTAYKNESFDLVLMDINIKGSTDGLQLAREMLRYKRVPIIFISAHSDDDTLEEALAISSCGFIPKPFSIKDVELVLGELEGKSTKEKRNLSYRNIITINDDYIYEINTKKIYYCSQEIIFSKKQQKLMHILCQNINKVVSLTVLEKEIWGNKSIVLSSLRTLVYSTRKVLPGITIVSHKKEGYMLKTM